MLVRRRVVANGCLLLRLRSTALHLWHNVHRPTHPSPPPRLASLPQGGVDLGRIASLEKDHKPVDTARKGDAVAMKIEVGAGRCCWAAVLGIVGAAGSPCSLAG